MNTRFFRVFCLLAFLLILLVAVGCRQGVEIGELQTQSETVELSDAKSVQVEIDLAAGELVVTRWSGRIHVLGPGEDERRDLQLPREDPAGLYYAAGLWDDEVCATYCADVAVVCAALP